MTARSLIVAVALAFLAPISAHADDAPGRVFNGRIMTSTKRFAMTAKSQGAFIANVRKLQQTTFMEDKASHTWTVYFIAFLKSPLNDVEYVIKLYDVGRGGQQLLGTMDEFNDSRGQTTIASKMTLDKNIVGVNRDLLVTLENKGKVYASTKIRILGEGEHFTGKVNFSDSDANGGSGAD
jgi:transcriptional regulator with PAS, ATPase and Fis domain